MNTNSAQTSKSILRYGTKRFLANYTPVYDPELGCSCQRRVRLS